MHWTRGETLGKGGFGFVSIAKTHQESHLPPLVAVKSAKLSESGSLSKEKELLDKFQNCPSILRCFGDDVTTENNEKLYNILLEYASGGCLVDRIHLKGLPENIVSRYTKSILKALIHIHKFGYVHCDVKPHNVLLVGDDQDAKLADFGSCKCWRDDIGKSCDFRGTVIYAAPESISRQEYVPESDVWALGCTVLQMLTGKSPWVIDRKTMEAKDVLFKIGCSNDIPEIQRHKISKEAKDFLKKCLVKDPRARWTADMLLDHPFLKMADHHLTARNRSHHHVSTRRLSHGIHSLVPHCFHVPKVHAFGSAISLNNDGAT
ncbi:hypothetical protein DH2020_002782 [Rehmannia glutinosa]|uniref:Protein kinase domain-containing protein n=1 Tax=Rehmannia glutinosa TaxID=99300 RepID=A0ABR0XUX0_REHGL